MRRPRRSLARLGIGLGVVLVVLVVLLFTPMGTWLGRGGAAAWRAISQLPGIAWRREQAATAETGGATTGSEAPSARLQELLRAAQSSEEAGAYERALERYREAIALNEEYAPAHEAAASVYMELGRTAEAAQALERATELDPQNGRIWAKLSQVYMHDERYDEAVGALEKARALEPDEPAISFWLGMAYYSRSMADAESAITELLRAADAEPADADIRVSLAMAYVQRGKEGDHDRAMEALARAIQLDPIHVQAHYLLGNMYLQSGDRDSAARVLRRLLELDIDSETTNRVREMLRQIESAGS